MLDNGKMLHLDIFAWHFAYFSLIFGTCFLSFDDLV